MASNSRQKTTMAKLTRERALRERRELKQSKKAARRRAAAASPVHETRTTTSETGSEAPPRTQAPEAAEPDPGAPPTS